MTRIAGAHTKGAGRDGRYQLRRDGCAQGVDLIGLGQLSGRLGKVPHLPWIGGDHGQTRQTGPATSGTSSPPVVSSTIKAGLIFANRLTRPSTPLLSCFTAKASPPGRMATSSRSSKRSMPTREPSAIPPAFLTAPRVRPALSLRVCPRVTVRACAGNRGAASLASRRPRRPRAPRSTAPRPSTTSAPLSQPKIQGSRGVRGWRLAGAPR